LATLVYIWYAGKMASKKNIKGKIIIPAGMKPRPRQHEIAAAEILAGYFKDNVEYQFKLVKSVKQLLFISKSGDVFEINR